MSTSQLQVNNKLGCRGGPEHTVYSDTFDCDDGACRYHGRNGRRMFTDSSRFGHFWNLNCGKQCGESCECSIESYPQDLQILAMRT